MSDKNLKRVAAYMRYSHEEQRGNTSLAVQIRMITDYVDRYGGVIVKIFTDEAKSGRSIEKRTQLNELRIAAQRGDFDSVVVATWDRFGRNMAEANAVKDELRDNYGLKIFSVMGMSADDGNATAAFVEGLQDLQAEHYSNELSEKYKRAKRELWLQGYYNGSNRPFGYDIKKIVVGTNRDGTLKTRNTLEVNQHEAALVVKTFEMYATGKFSYMDLADMLNTESRSTNGRRHSHSSIKEMFNNVLYLGLLSYQESRLNKARTKRYYDKPIEIAKGLHPAIVSQELFDKVKTVRDQRKRTKHGADGHNDYLLRGLVYCWSCYEQRHEVEGKIPHWAKMHCRLTRHKTTYYKCMATSRGYKCSQSQVQTSKIDDQVLDILFSLNPPADWRKHIVNAIEAELRDATLAKRIEQLAVEIERMNELFIHGFVVDKAEFIAAQAKRKTEYERLKPPANSDLYEIAAKLVDKFPTQFEACNNDVQAQNELISRLVDRIYVRGTEVVAITFKGDVHAVLHLGGKQTVEYR